MYNHYFGMSESPFSIVPDPRFMFMSEHHREALSHLFYGIQGEGGFVLLTGEVGTGKTMVCRSLIDQLPDDCDVAFIIHSKLTAVELLETLCDELHIDYSQESTIKVLIDRINDYLLDAHARGRNTLLIVDEAHNLDPDVLEQLRLLTNLETNQKKLLQIVLIGQPEILEILERQELRQVAQRITARYHINPLSKDELTAYVGHRLATAGCKAQLFPPSVINRLYQVSHGIPRLVNMLCDRALLGTYAQNRLSVDKKTLGKAFKEVFGNKKAGKTQEETHWMRPGRIAFPVMAAFSLMAFLGLYYGPEEVNGLKKYMTSMFHEQVIDPPTLTDDSYEIVGGTNQIKSTSHISELELLLEYWGVDTDQYNFMNYCESARNHGLSCYQVSGGTVSGLLQFNRPAIVTLDDNGSQARSLLTGISAGEVTVIREGVEHQLSIDTFVGQWDGNYALLWKTPAGYEKPLYIGKESIVVGWLKKQFTDLGGFRFTGNAGTLFDDELHLAVKKFQEDQGLKVDGVVGPQTIMRLNTALDEQVPRLLQSIAG